jgi:hypothetical protein
MGSDGVGCYGSARLSDVGGGADELAAGLDDIGAERTVMVRVRPNSSTKRSGISLCSWGRKLYPGAALDMPYPGKSGATQRNWPANPAMILR